MYVKLLSNNSPADSCCKPSPQTPRPGSCQRPAPRLSVIRAPMPSGNIINNYVWHTRYTFVDAGFALRGLLGEEAVSPCQTGATVVSLSVPDSSLTPTIQHGHSRVYTMCGQGTILPDIRSVMMYAIKSNAFKKSSNLVPICKTSQA